MPLFSFFFCSVPQVWDPDSRLADSACVQYPVLSLKMWLENFPNGCWNCPANFQRSELPIEACFIGSGPQPLTDHLTGGDSHLSDLNPPWRIWDFSPLKCFWGSLLSHTHVICTFVLPFSQQGLEPTEKIQFFSLYLSPPLEKSFNLLTLGAA